MKSTFIKYNVLIFFVVCLIGCTTAPNYTQVNLKIIETSDVHGNYFPYDFINQTEWQGGLARVASYVDSLRQDYGSNLLLFDNGDILQGQPSAYYYNYIDTASVHISADMMNFMRYDAGNIGNHDLETGHPVYDRWIEQCDFPILGANVIDISTGEPYLQPYAVFEREGVKIVVLGLITPAIPAWLFESLWSGLDFEDMEESARKWVPIIQKKENPDILIGLFHTGKDARMLLDKYREDAAVEIAQRVPGFDVMLIGHDHALFCEKIVNNYGDSVLIINPANDVLYVGEVDINVTIKNGKVDKKHISGKLTNIEDYSVCTNFMNKYASEYDTIKDYVSEKIGVFTTSMRTRDAYFGPSALVDFIHTIQLDVSKADISLASPLSLDATVQKGEIRIADMFNLYKFENFLYTMEITGAELKQVLEESYTIWTNQMQSPDDNILLLRSDETRRRFFANYYFLFDSAAGIKYTVNVTKPKGEKITILSMADGSPFDEDKIYKVAVTSYRGNGGGELLTRALGLSQERLKDRVIATTENDLRYYMIDYIRKRGTLSPKPLDLWKFIPEEWTREAIQRDSLYLFGERR